MCMLKPEFLAEHESAINIYVSHTLSAPSHRVVNALYRGA